MFAKILKFLDPTKLPIIKQILDKFDKSTKDHLGKESASRIGFYCFVLLIMFISIWTVIANSLSYEVLTLIGLLIGQLSILLNIKKNSEKSPFPSLDELNKIKNDIEKNKISDK